MTMSICGQGPAQVINLGYEPVNNQAEGILDLT
jgi:hypothetical protein